MDRVQSMRPLVSVVTPVFNHERFIGSCIESVLAQSFDNWEMILVDDGSTDRSVEIIRSYQDPRLKLIEQKNRGIAGLADTYNAAIAASSGDLIAILEGDDLWPKYKLEIQCDDFTDDAVALSSGLTSIVDEVGTFITITPAHPIPTAAAVNRPVGAALKTMLHPEGLTFTFPVSTIIRADALRRAGGFCQPKGMSVVDLPTFARIALEGEFRFHYEVCGAWRRHEGSTTRHKFPAILESCYQEAFDFIHAYRPRIPLTDGELDELDLEWQHYMGQLCMLRGRMLASERQWSLAARAFKEGLMYNRSRPMDIAIRSGSLLSRFHMPSEWLFKAYGRPDWRRVVIQGSGDWLVSPEDMDRKRPVARWRS
jgi:hypothetical protein